MSMTFLDSSIMEKKLEQKAEVTRERDLAPHERAGRDRHVEERDLLVESMLPMVRRMIGRVALFLPNHLSHEDLWGVGAVALVNAIDRYDPAKGASLKTYCSLRIRGAILDELRRHSWVPRSVQKSYQKLLQVQEGLAQKLGREPTEPEMAHALDLSLEDLQALVEKTRPTTHFSLQQAVGLEDENGAFLHEEVLPDENNLSPDDRLLNKEDRGLLLEQLQVLPRIQGQVLILYYLEDLRIKDIAGLLGLTESRVSQIHTDAMERLRNGFARARKR